MDIDTLITFLDDQLKDCKRLQTSWCIFGVGVPSAMGASKAKAFKELEEALGIDGPFTNHERKAQENE